MQRVVLILSLAYFSLAEGFSAGEFHFDFAISNIPAPEKKQKGGEDAYFANKWLLSVADGVGGWAEHGIDPAKYSRRLAANVSRFFAKNKDKYISDPKALLIRSARKNTELGSSTFAIVVLNPQTGLLKTSYIGDSSYMILRPNPVSQKLEIFHRSKEQQHSFNMPFQVGYYGDNPSNALIFEHQLQDGDLVVVGTDGLFDNIFNKKILAVVDALKEKPTKEISQALADLAFKLSLNEKYRSPFSVEAKKAKFYYLGGKSDDITVIVGKVRGPNRKNTETG